MSATRETRGQDESERDLRLPRRHRLTRRSEIRRAYRRGARARGELLTVIAAESGRDHPRLLLSVGRRCWPGAVPRNRVRRVFREAFRLSLDDLPPADLVLIASTPRLRPELEAVRAEILELARVAWARLGRKRAGTGQTGGNPAGAGRTP